MTSKIESLEQGTSMIDIQGLYEEDETQIVKEKAKKIVMIKTRNNSRSSRPESKKASNLQKQNYQMVEIDDRNEYGSSEHTRMSPTHSLRKKDYLKNNQKIELDFLYGISNSA